MQKLNQKGATLIIFAVIMVLAVTTLLLSQLNGPEINIQRDKKTSKALAEAKAALIGYAITYDDNHAGELYGYLPCPDINPIDPSGEGAQSICGNLGVSTLGRFPWKTLKLEPLKDGNSECLWYVVSGNYKNNPKLAGISPNRLGLLEVMSASGVSFIASNADPAVAIVFSAGTALSGQDRTKNDVALHCDGNYISTNYLDRDVVSNINNSIPSGMANVNSTFIAAKDSGLTAQNDDAFNDKLIVIRRSDIFAAYCKKYANSLLNNISGNTNNCNNASNPSASCSAVVGYLQNCNLICKDSAQTFIDTPCLSDITTPNCQTAINSLEVCHA